MARVLWLPMTLASVLTHVGIAAALTRGTEAAPDRDDTAAIELALTETLLAEPLPQEPEPAPPPPAPAVSPKAANEPSAPPLPPPPSSGSSAPRTAESQAKDPEPAPPPVPPAAVASVPSALPDAPSSERPAEALGGTGAQLGSSARGGPDGHASGGTSAGTAARVGPTGPSPASLADYARRLASAVGRHKRYPQVSRERGEQGVTVVVVRVLANGRLASPVRVTRSSGHARLDAEALRMVTVAAPFTPLPDAAEPSLELALPVRFELGDEDE